MLTQTNNNNNGKPRLQMSLKRCADVIISADILYKCADHIKENADEDGYFSGEFTIEDRDEIVDFEIDCQLFYRKEDRQYCTGTLFTYAVAKTYNKRGKLVTNDFTINELITFIKD